MAVKIQLRRGTAAQWTSANPILYEGEFGFETDTRRYKIGNGIHAWNDNVNLPYYATGTLTGVTTASGSGLTGGALSGTLTLAVDPSVVITNAYVDARGDLVTATANNTPAILSLGTDGQVLIADPSTVGNTRGIKWGQITAAGIESDAVTTAKILDSNVTLTKLASAVQNLLIPAGTIAATVKATADTGWQFMGQTLTNAEGVYPALFAAAPVSWRTGTAPNRNLVLPSMTDRTLFQAGTTTLGATGGLNTATLGVSNLPAHTHTASSSSSSSSTVTDPTHRHEEAGRDTNTTGAYKYLQRIGGDGANYDVTNAYGTTRWDSITNPQTTYASTGITVTTSTSTSTTVSGGGNGTSTGNAFATTNAHLAVNYQIKAH